MEPLVTVPDGFPAAVDPETFPGCVPTDTGMVVFVSDQLTVFVLTLEIPSEIVQYIVPELVEFAFTDLVTAVVAEFGFVNDADPLAMCQV